MKENDSQRTELGASPRRWGGFQWDGRGVTLRLVCLGVHRVDLQSGKGTGAELSLPHPQTCSSSHGPHLLSIIQLLRPQTLESS